MDTICQEQNNMPEAMRMRYLLDDPNPRYSTRRNKMMNKSNSITMKLRLIKCTKCMDRTSNLAIYTKRQLGQWSRLTPKTTPVRGPP
jgi:hypothetical protein